MQTNLLSAVAASTLLAGCTTGNLSRVSGIPIRTDSSRQLRLRSVDVYDSGASTLIRVERRQGRGIPGRPGGRLLIEALKEGRVVANRNIHWYALRRGPFRGAAYRAELPVPVSAIDEIRISRATSATPTCPEGKC